MDLLRDHYYAQVSKWTCKFCRHPHAKRMIEAKLVESLQKKSLNFQIQDLVCEKCKLVKADNMSDICANCSGKFVCKETPEAFMET